MSISQETRAAAHVELGEDAELTDLITTLFTDVEDSNMAQYWIS